MNESYGWIEFVVFGPLILGVLFWQLWSVNREIRADRARRAADEAQAQPASLPASLSPGPASPPPGSAGATGHAEGQHPLDGGRDEPRQ